MRRADADIFRLIGTTFCWLLTLAYDCSPHRVRDLLRYTRLKEASPRSGFVENAAYQKLMSHTDKLWLRALLACGYTFGFRLSELTSMKVGQIDLHRSSMRLAAGTTKNDDGRTVIMTNEVRGLLTLCVHGKQPDDYVFTRSDGEPVFEFRHAWRSLCQKAGLGRLVAGKWVGLLFHDLRRSAVRNMIRASVPEVVAMKISRHKTRAVFDRYNIVSESDLADAAVRLESARKKPTDTTTDTDIISAAAASAKGFIMSDVGAV